MPAITPKHILVIPLFLMASLSFGQNQTRKKLLKHVRETYIGIYRGVDLIDVSRPTHNKNYLEAVNNSFVVSIPVITHFKVETGLSYRHIISGTQNNITQAVPFGRQQKSLTVPVTIQYFMRPDNCRLQPYFGVGAIFSPEKQSNIIELQNDSYLSHTGTKYVSIMFTQGVTFQVNTKIQLNESMHFLQIDGKNTMGMNLGIGFKLP